MVWGWVSHGDAEPVVNHGDAGDVFGARIPSRNAVKSEHFRMGTSRFLDVFGRYSFNGEIPMP